MDAYGLHEVRLLNEKVNSSGADALNISFGPVPAGRIWTIIYAFMIPSVGETRTVWFSVSSGSNTFPISVPTNIALLASNGFPLLIQGNELKLYPGQYLRAYRDVATAGSSISLSVMYVDSPLPPYEYAESYTRAAATKRRSAGSSFGGGFAGGGGVGGTPAGARGGPSERTKA